MLKLLDDKIISCINAQAVFADETEQSDDFKGSVYAAIIRAEKGSPGTPTTLPRSGLTDTDSARTSGAAFSTKSNCVKLPELALHSFSWDITHQLTFLNAFISL